MQSVAQFAWIQRMTTIENSWDPFPGHMISDERKTMAVPGNDNGVVRPRITRRSLLRKFGVCSVASLGLGGNLFAYGRLLEPTWAEVTRPSVVLPGLAAPFDGYRIAQISDIHLDNDWMTRERLADLVRTVNDLAPDLIAITGDFITDGPLDLVLPILRDELGRLRAPDGVAAVRGNHDHWTGP